MRGEVETLGGVIDTYGSEDNNSSGRYCEKPSCWHKADTEINGASLCRYHAKHLLGVSS